MRALIGGLLLLAGWATAVQAGDTAPAAGTDRHAGTSAASRHGYYGPVSPSDTLWSVAARLRPSLDVSIPQVLVAIYRGNPKAFDGDIDHLRKGALLRVPSSAEMTRLTQEQARAELSRLESRARRQAKKPVARIAAPVAAAERPASEPPPPASPVSPAPEAQRDAGPPAAAPVALPAASASAPSPTDATSPENDTAAPDRHAGFRWLLVLLAGAGSWLLYRRWRRRARRRRYRRPAKQPASGSPSRVAPVLGPVMVVDSAGDKTERPSPGNAEPSFAPATDISPTGP